MNRKRNIRRLPEIKVPSPEITGDMRFASPERKESRVRVKFSETIILSKR